MPPLFQGQLPSEEVLLVAKQHPLVLLRPMLFCVLVLLVPFVANILLSFGTAMAIIVIVCLGLAGLRGMHAYHAWNNSILLLTSQRVVVLVQRSLTDREFSECGLHMIQRVSHEVKGLSNTLFGYGNIQIYTGSSMAPFVIPNAPKPYELQQEIQRAVARQLEQ